MKKLFSLMFVMLAIMMPMKLWAQEPYAVLTTDSATILSQDSTGVTYGKTLTFYYDNQKTARGGMSVGPFTNETARGWSSYVQDITTVVFDDTFTNCTTLTSTAFWFYGCEKLTDISGIGNLKTDNVTNMYTMFYGCSGLTNLDVSNFKTDNVTDMRCMFYGCSGLTNLDVSNFKTYNVTDMSWMFLGCTGLTSLDLSSFNTSNVKYDANIYNYGIQSMFEGCSALTTIWVGDNWTTANLTESVDVFKDCAALVGGAGTHFDPDHVDYTYAHIDGGTSNPGYFTDKNAVAEPYAVISNGNTMLTFYYDDKKTERDGLSVGPFSNMLEKGWGDYMNMVIMNVVFDASFANCTTLTSTADWFSGCSYLTTITGIEYLNTDNVTNMNRMFYGCSHLTTLDISNFNTSNVTDMAEMFGGCSGLTTLNVSNFNTSNVTNMSSMFSNCSGLTSLDVSNFNTSNVTNMNSMFDNCSGLTSLDIRNFNTPNVTDMGAMFYGCSGLISLDLSNLNTDSVTVMKWMFTGCSGLTNIDLSKFNTSKVTEMSRMFEGCSSLTSLELNNFNTSTVIHMDKMFMGCSSLASLDLSHFETPLLIDVNSMFRDAAALTTIYVGDSWDMTYVSNGADMFTGCTNLVGGMGTTYDENHVDGTYAHIDGGSSNPGYFTDVNGPSQKVAMPALAWNGDELTISTTTTDAAIYYKMTEGTANAGSTIPAFLSEYATPDELIANGDDDEASAWLWFHENYPNGKYVYFGNISTLQDIKDYGMLFWLRDIETRNVDDIWNISDVAKNAAPAIEQYVKSGGNLLLWSHAVPYIGTINRLPESLLRSVNNAFNCGPGGINTDTWKMGVCVNTGSFSKDFSSHPIYAGIPTEIANEQCFSSIPMKGAGWTEDHNCVFFDIPAQLTGLNNQTKECYDTLTTNYGIYPLGTWDSFVSWTSQLNVWEAKGADMAPEGFQKGAGTVLCIGNGGCEFSMKNEDGTPDKSATPKNNPYQQNILKLASNSIQYLLANAASEVVRYTGPITVTKDVQIEAWAEHMGMISSDTITLDYPYTAWQGLLIAVADANAAIQQAAGNDNVPQQMINELAARIDEAQLMYRYREAQEFVILDKTAQIRELTDAVVRLANAEAEPYAVLSENNTIVTFYYDKKKDERGGMDINNSNILFSSPYGSATTAVIDASFADYQPTSTAYWFMKCSSLTSITGMENLKTDNVTNMSEMFDGCSGLTNLDVSNFKTDNVTNMSNMFRNCSSLTSLNVSGFNTDNVTAMNYMFSGCSGLTSLDVTNFNTANVTNMQAMFEGCYGLTTIYTGNEWSTAAVTSGGEMFTRCTKLVGGAGTTYDENHIDYTYAHIDGGTSNPGYFTDKNASLTTEPYVVLTTDTTSVLSSDSTGVTYGKTLTFYYDNLKVGRNGMNIGPFESSSERGWNSNADSITVVVFDDSFANCTTLTSTALWFSGCRNLKTIVGIENLKTDHVTTMFAMFDCCNSLTSLDVSKFNTENVTRMNDMFSDCRSLTSLDVTNFNTAKVTDMCDMFINCSSLTSLDVSNFKTDSVTNMSFMFIECSGLTSLDLSNFNTAKVTDMSKMFAHCSGLKTIYVGEEWSTAAVTSGGDMFYNCTKLIGGRGTTYDENHTDYTYAHIDGGTSNPGYFTDKNAPVIEATFDGRVLAVGGSTTMTDALESVGGRDEVAKTITAIVWNSSATLSNSDLQGLDNPNLLIYVNERSQAPQNRNNVVVNGLAMNVVLSDTGSGNCDFYAPQTFTAEMITYSREFKQATQVGVCRGWETISLPFMVQTIAHADNGVITPFGVDSSNKHFWLRQLSTNGLVSATKIEANQPYLISMPNDEKNYAKEYILKGLVTFSAENAVVPKTEPTALALADSSIVMMPALQSVGKSSTVWALNVGMERSQYFEGSTFERDYREVRPFEAYTVHRSDTPAPRFLPINDLMNSATGIETISNVIMTHDNYYHLDGRKVDGKPTKKGLYITNGRKVVIK